MLLWVTPLLEVAFLEIIKQILVFMHVLLLNIETSFYQSGHSSKTAWVVEAGQKGKRYFINVLGFLVYALTICNLLYIKQGNRKLKRLGLVPEGTTQNLKHHVQASVT
jgi:hypothetical protein